MVGGAPAACPPPTSWAAPAWTSPSSSAGTPWAASCAMSSPRSASPARPSDNDVRLMEAMGVKAELNTEVKNVQELFAQGFTHVILATGAWQKGSAGLEYGEERNVIEFLEAAKKAPIP